MMGWETPLMKVHADIICPRDGLRILNVGFGLGIIDLEIQQKKPASHTIIEAHPDVYRKMIQDGWDKIEGVKIIFGRWQDVLDQLEVYDGIFFDTFGEFYDDLKEFHDHLPNILDEKGIYSYFNGLAGTNMFFHDVACKIAECDLSEIGMSIEYKTINVQDLGQDVWNGIKRAYWTLPQYKAPIGRLLPMECLDR
jgi:protein arginine N-methyltransferase 2